MVRIGKGQAILGGYGKVHGRHTKIYSMDCSNRNCTISLLNRELSVARYLFVAIPIPDKFSGCTTERNINFHNSGTFYIIFTKYIPLNKVYQIPLTSVTKISIPSYVVYCGSHIDFLRNSDFILQICHAKSFKMRYIRSLYLRYSLGYS